MMFCCLTLISQVLMEGAIAVALLCVSIHADLLASKQLAVATSWSLLLLTQRVRHEEIQDSAALMTQSLSSSEIPP